MASAKTITQCSGSHTRQLEPAKSSSRNGDRIRRHSGPPGRRQPFALFGFSEELDLRPLHFVEPPPPARVCSACGLVLTEAGFLPCGHVLCRPCYQQCAAPSTCPLDKEACPDEGVDWKEFPAESLMRRQVKCWNDANGCEAVIPLSQICKHFRHDCKHHLARCTKCSATVLWSNLSMHLASQCDASGELGDCPEGSVIGKQEGLEEPHGDVMPALQSTPPSMEMEQRGTAPASTTATGLRSNHGGEGTAFGVKCEAHEYNSRSRADRPGAGLNGRSHSVDGIRETASNESRQPKKVPCSSNARFIEMREEQTKGLTVLKTVLEDRMGKIKAGLDRLLAESNVQNGRLSEHLQSMNAFSETVQKKLEQLSRTQCVGYSQFQSMCSLTRNLTKEMKQLAGQHRTSLANSAAHITDIRDKIRKESQNTLRSINTALQHARRCAKTRQWILRGYAALKESAIRDGEASHESRRVYLSDYFMSVGLFFKASGESVSVHLLYHLHKGAMDEFLRWPFQEKMRLSIIHPDSHEKCVVLEQVAVAKMVASSRPKSSSNDAVYGKSELRSGDLELDGYVKDDRLLLKFEIVT